MIPKGSNPENYQPNLKTMMKISDSSTYFSIGLPTEHANILPKLSDFNETIEIIDLNSIVSEFYPNRNFSKDDHEHEGYDPHIWVNPKRAILITETILSELIKLQPEDEVVFTKNAEILIGQLNDVDQLASDILSKHRGKHVIILHPAIGYITDEYGINLLVIEDEGKDATFLKLKEIIDIAESEKINAVFYQSEIDPSQAKTVAAEINASLIEIRPLGYDLIDSLTEIIQNIDSSFNNGGE
jgi:zinc transport system substrate-binding protein